MTTKITTDELRDWHAIQKGWIKCKLKNRWHSPWNNKDGICDCNGILTSAVDSHPYEHTIDGAASAMPKGWQWTRTFAEGDYWAWVAVLVGGLGCRVVVRDTGDEIHDRYLLAKLAKEAMNAQSR